MILSEAEAKRIYMMDVFHVDGHRGTIQDLVKEFNVKALYGGVKTSRPIARFTRENTIRRIRLGWSVEEILFTPFTYPKMEDEIISYLGQTDEAYYVAVRHNIPLSVLISRMTWELPLDAIFARV